MDGLALGCMRADAGARLVDHGAGLGVAEQTLRGTTPAAYLETRAVTAVAEVDKAYGNGCSKYRLHVGRVRLNALPRC